MTIYAVNGKEPVAAWIPSLDTAGNGTTTLTDLVGTIDGVLTDMDPATDWVADAGGTTKLVFDGVNDRVLMPYGDALGLIATQTTYSFWLLIDAIPAAFSGIIETAPNIVGGIRVICFDNKIRFHHAGDVGVQFTPPGGWLGSWHHLLATKTAGQLWTAYIDGVSIGSYTSSLSSVVNVFNVATVNGAGYTAFAIDDIRLWNQVLDVDDIAYLYDGGTGRGITSDSAARIRSRQPAGIPL
jgi:hypothetical protein